MTQNKEIYLQSRNAAKLPSFIQTVVCLTTGSQAFAKPALHTEPSNVSYINLQYPLFLLKTSSSCLRLIARHPVISILPSTFPPIMSFKKQFLRKM
jgi:hypothetical protein